MRGTITSLKIQLCTHASLITIVIVLFSILPETTQEHAIPVTQCVYKLP